MILTLTANPSMDRTIELSAPLAHGAVQRAAAAVQDPGGKGVNISRALHAASVPTEAIVPGDAHDPVLTVLTEQHVAYSNLPTGEPIRSNITVVDPDGTTTKLNAPGTRFDQPLREALDALVIERALATNAHWVILAGSLPAGLPSSYYAELIAALRAAGFEGKIALDTSEQTLIDSLAQEAKPSLIKPNSEELAQLTGASSWEELESSAELTARTAASLLGGGIEYVLATLGGGGAVLVTESGAWHAIHEPIKVRSTVGAGDSSLAGFVIASEAGASPEDALLSAVAYGSAAASLPGTRMPVPAEISIDKVTRRELAL
ncbi:MAG: 1-phosphofructokinase family hexose kinase [Rothia sp. (in: high G+C Gram-positive bacteria)]|uniref:1-phosphofructokinase family hexose kinase n=1 Tax=Rothia sp. (in: high G+C Gram-positive bacteria) TaxID=1885016 RepID=UPI0026DF3585|nr:1-phosphofructokinase family hexose kinase [Rothia sp. (in: high G+C Gram-positive bacteria)]MDO5749804.1 1-phosphofructokinase family hexose kinase [Rothia sp. (in: high G+C Gram-positive bacteria)]